MLRVLALLALAACCAAASAVPESVPKAASSELALPEAEAKAREQRSVDTFLQTLNLSPSSKQGGKDQSFNIGGVYPYDRQLLSKTVYKSSSWMSVNKKELVFSGPYTIHCIQIVDLLKTGKNAAVTVQNGGIGQTSVTMKFKSQRGEKINYLVIVWGQ